VTPAGAASRRPLLGSSAEIAFTVALLAWAVAEAAAISSDHSTAARIAFAVVAVVPLALRHAFPLWVAAWSLAAVAVNSAAALLPIEAVTPLQEPAIATFAIAAYAGRRRWPLALAMVPALVAVLAVFDTRTMLTLHDVIAVVVIQSLALAAGLAVGLRREEAARAAGRLADVEAGAESRVAAGLARERLRIAGELQAIVARDVGAVRALAAQARRELDAGDDRALDRFRAIGATAADALEEMRRLLSVLGEEHRHAGGPPDDLDGAVAAARTRGWDVRVAARDVTDPPAEAAADGPALGAARIVEELLAGPAPAGGRAVVLRTRHEDGALRLVVGGRGRAPDVLRDEVGLAGLHERALRHGGVLWLGPRIGRWRLEVVLPDGGETVDVRRADAAGRFGDRTILLLALVAVGLDAISVPPDIAVPCAVSGLVLVVLPLLFRRRAPLGVACALAAALLIRPAAGWMPALVPWSLVLVLAVAPYAAAAYATTRTRAILGGVVVAVASLLERAFLQPELPATDLPIVLCFVAVSWMAGWYARGSLRRTAQLTAGQARASREQRWRLDAAVARERRRVARDLHDVVAHGVSLIGVLAGSAEATLARDPARTRATLDALDGAAAQTTVELRRLLAALRVAGADEEPVVLLDDLPELIAGARAAGQVVRLHADVAALAGVSDGVSASAYRIAQESLTNARKHAPRAEADVRLAVAASELVISVTNGPGAGPADGDGSGRGIGGMRARARLIGGRLDAHPTPDGGFRVRARLPLL